MIFHLFLSLSVLVLLLIEGRCVVRLLGRGTLTRLEEWALGLPVGAFVNVLLFFVLTLTGISSRLWIVFGAHVFFVAGLMALVRWMGIRTTTPGDVSQDRFSFFIFPSSSSTLFKRIVIVLIAFSLAVKLLYGFTHAVLLPTYYYDTLSQWNMRSRISFEEQQIAFDETQMRGISKPQYPILLHSLQIAAMLPQDSWRDRIANAATFLLTLSSFAAFFLLLRRAFGFLFAFLTSAALFSIPLLTMHLTQGYGDVHVVEYLLLSAVFLACSFEAGVSSRAETRGDTPARVYASSPLSMTRAFLSLSALFAAAAPWVKLEGFFFALLPWLLLASGLLLFSVPREQRRPGILAALVPGAALGSLWVAFLLMKGFAIGPHGDDLVLRWHGQGVRLILRALFLSGSFGIFWYALPLLLAFLLPKALQDWKQHIAALSLVLWGAITFFETLAIYLLTPNVEFLLNNQTFHRTMLLPLVLLVLGTALLLRKRLSRAAVSSMRAAPGVLVLLFVSLFPTGVEAQSSLQERLRETELAVRAIPRDLDGIPRGAQSIRFLGLELQASCDGNIALTSMRVHLLGKGEANAIRGVYLLRGAERLTRSTTFSSDDRTAVLRPTNLVLGACAVMRLDVAADLSSEVATGSEYRIEVRRKEDIASNATRLVGSFPIRNPGMIASSVTPRAAGALTVEFLPLSKKPRTVVEEVLAKFTVEANQDSHHLIYAVTLTNEGSAQGEEVRNLSLTTSGGRALTQVAKTMEGKSVTLQFSSPYFLRKGQKVGFELHGRLYSANETVNFTLKEPGDLRAIPQWSRGRKL